MIIELISVLAVFIGGCALVRAAGIKDWAWPALGFIAGVSLLITVGLIQIVLHLPTTPILTLSLTVGVPLGVWIARQYRRGDVRVPLAPAALSIAGVAAAVLVLRQASLVNWHGDSIRYLMTGSIIANNSFHDVVTPNLLTKRLIATGLVHAPANLAGEHYLHSMTPLLAASTLATLAWLLQRGIGAGLGRTWFAILAVTGVALLLSNNRFVFHAFNLNGHLIFATLLLIIAGCGWLLVMRASVPVAALFMLQALAIPALVVTRAEASMVAVLALLPMLLSPQVPRRLRAAALGTLGGSVVLWQGYVLLAIQGQNARVTLSVTGLLLLGVMILLLTPLMRWRLSGKWSTRFLLLVEAGLWMSLAVLVVLHPQVLLDSARATFVNVVVGEGSWGISLVLLAGLVLGAAVAVRTQHLVCLRFPVTTFVPLSFVLAYLREGAYRIGEGDSLNRMLIQVVPLAILFVIAAIGAGAGRFRMRPSESVPVTHEAPVAPSARSVAHASAISS